MRFESKKKDEGLRSGPLPLPEERREPEPFRKENGEEDEEEDNPKNYPPAVDEPDEEKKYKDPDFAEVPVEDEPPPEGKPSVSGDPPLELKEEKKSIKQK